MSAISSLGGAASGLSFSGLASGIDSKSIVESLLAVERLKVTSLQAQQATLTALQGTFGNLRSGLADLQTKVGQLARSVGGPFEGKKATSSDETALRAAAGASAAPGQYTFTVAALASAHQVASQGLADQATLLKTGTLQLQVGGVTKTITVDPTNNTLQGLASAINVSGAGVQAAVINDGSATPYRLLLSSTKTGVANQIQITNGLTQGGGGASLNLDTSTQTIQQAADAQIIIGGGAGAITVNSASNTVEALVPGVTVNLLKADPSKPVTLTVSNDTAAAEAAITDFVDSYNRVIDFINERTTYDQDTQRAGILLGSNDAATLENTLAATVGAAVRSASRQAARLSSIGVTFTDKGNLQIDKAKLGDALSEQSGGVGLAEVRRLFSLTGGSDNTKVNFLLGTTQTRSTTTPVGVKVTQAAAQASLTAGAAVSAPVTIDGTNNRLLLSVSGKALDVQLAEGAYDAAALAAQLQGAINGAGGAGASAVKVTQAGGVLNITTEAFGGAANVTITGGSALSALGFTAAQTASGQNVAGYFLANGVRESATGAGQTLIGAAGNPNTDGLQVKVTLAANELNADPDTPEASVTVSRGLASELDRVLNTYLDPVRGRMKNIGDGFQRQIDDLQDAVTRTNLLISQKNDALLRQFADMETAVNKLKAIGATVSSQLASLASLGSGSSNSGSSNSSQ